jgi:acetoin utilization deacetylase AcuC-like enzyme
LSPVIGHLSLKTVSFIGHPDYQAHNTGEGHPERADRVRAIHARLKDSGLESDLLLTDPFHADEDWITRGHAEAHIKNVKARCEHGAPCMEDYETMLSPGSFDIARLGIGATFKATDQVFAGEADRAFCAVRPPGHHAEYSRAMGFCLFNNVVIAARYAQETYGIERVMILDWDVHHGNGTQHILEEDPSVFYFSVHQYPHYPGTGAREEKGLGNGIGATLNAPVIVGTDDDAYLRIFDDELLPAMDAFKPEFIIVSAGFDAHVNDPLSGTLVTESGFAKMTERALSIAADHANGRLISVLEGGYDLDGLSSSVEAHLQTLLNA